MNEKTTKWSAMFTMLVALFTLIAVSMVLSIQAAAEKAEIDAIEDLSSSSAGTTNVATPTPHAGTYCIKMINGASGEIDLDDRFYTGDITLQYQVASTAQHLIITLKDSENTANSVDIDFWIPTSDDGMKGKISDNMEGGQSDTGDASSSSTRLDKWLPIEISLTETTKSTDGTTKSITCEMDNEVLTTITLQSGDLTQVKERGFDGVEITVGGDDTIYIDTMVVDTDAASAYSYTWLFWGSVTVIGITFATWYTGFYPFKAGGPLGKYRRVK